MVQVRLSNLLLNIHTDIYTIGLALRGPLGSMKKAIDGMYVEQKETLAGVVLSIVLFSVELCIIFALEMYEIEAAVCSAMFAFSMLFISARSCIRIYNRFKYVKFENADSEAEWDDPNTKLTMKGEYTPPNVTELRKEIYSGGNETSTKSNHNTVELGSVSDNKSVASTKTRKTYRIDGNQGNSKLSAKDIILANNSEKPKHMVYLEGYLTLQVKDNSWFGSNNWERKYFVLIDTALWYYSDKYAYEKASNKPCIFRPIQVPYYLCNYNANSYKPPYEFELHPNDAMIIGNSGDRLSYKRWSFRCDTIEELKNWIEVFNKSCKMSLPNSSNLPESQSQRMENDK